jgi:hypothetical protein
MMYSVSRLAMCDPHLLFRSLDASQPAASSYSDRIYRISALLA